uniref:Uncharacterized protein n=1 Tax=Arundo donax TaxID=35708 RepID=A0A0A9AAI6_ARUDO
MAQTISNTAQPPTMSNKILQTSLPPSLSLRAWQAHTV